MADRQAASVEGTGGWKRWLPVAALVLVMAAVIGMGWHKHLSLKAIGLNYEALKAIIAQNLWLSVAAYIGLYTAVVALSLPAATAMTLASGLLFGWKIGAPASVAGATLGATIVFLIVNTSFGQTLASRAGPFVGRLREGFQENALSYLLFLRLVPVFPFFIVNLVPALLGVGLPTFVIGTLVGIIPGTTAYALAGNGLASVIEAQNATYNACVAAAQPGVPCAYEIDVTQIVTRELIWAGVALGIVALIPVVLKRWNGAHGKG